MPAVPIEPQGPEGLASSAFDPEDRRWELSPGAYPLAATGWYQSQPDTVRARMGFALRTLLVRRALAVATTIQDALFGVALRLSSGDPGVLEACLDAIDAERGRAVVLQEAFVRTTDAQPLPENGDVVAFSLAMLLRWWPDLALALAVTLPDPLSMVRRLSPPAGEMGLDALSRAAAVADRSRIGALASAVASMASLHRGLLRLAVPVGLALLLPRVARPPRTLLKAYDVPVDVVDQVERERSRDDAMARDAAAARFVCEETGLVGARSRALWGFVWPEGPRPGA